jgi:hypothetical protein
MGVGRVLDVGFRIVRRHWAVLLGLAVLFVGPGALLTAATGVRFTDVAIDVFPALGEGVIDENVAITEAELERLVGALIAYVGATIVAGVLASIGALGFSAVVGADYHHRGIAFGEGLRTAVARVPSALVFILVTTVVIVAIALAGLALIVVTGSVLGSGTLVQGGPGVFLALLIVVAIVVLVAYLTMRWAPALPVLAVEGGGWRRALSRSWFLSAENVWRIFAVVILASLATAVLTALASNVLAIVLVDVVASSIGLDPAVAMSVAAALATVLFAALAPVWTAVLYFDLRVRRHDAASAPATGPG